MRCPAPSLAIILIQCFRHECNAASGRANRRPACRRPDRNKISKLIAHARANDVAGLVIDHRRDQDGLPDDNSERLNFVPRFIL